MDVIHVSLSQTSSTTSKDKSNPWTLLEELCPEFKPESKKYLIVKVLSDVGRRIEETPREDDGTREILCHLDSRVRKKRS